MKIFYFGGYRSTHDDVVAWKNSLEDKLTKLLYVAPQVTVFHYPDGASAGNPLAQWRHQSTEWIIQQMEDSLNNMIVGHSSGCAIANDVAEHALFEGKKFRLIALDGFCPNDKLLALPGTRVWSAANMTVGKYSLNFWALKARANHCFCVYQTKVEEKWPLHFSLVNLNVDDDHIQLAEGYRNCDTNLQVLGLDNAGMV